MTSRADLIQQLADLFRETGRVHHQAFIATDGDDPEWPLWYAGYLQEKIGALLNTEFTRSELVYLLVSAEREQALRAPGEDWTIYYARFFVERYGSAGTTR